MLIFQPAEVVITHRAQAHPGWMAAETQNHHTDAVTCCVMHRYSEMTKHAEREAPIPPPLPPPSPAQLQSDLALHAELEAQTSDGSDKSISDMLPHISVFL